jgi:hypothetical protein
MLFSCMSLRLNVAFVSEAYAVRCPELACVVSFVALYWRYDHCNSIVRTVCFQVSKSEAVSIGSFLQHHVLLSTSKEYVNKFEIITSDLLNILTQSDVRILRWFSLSFRPTAA